VLRSERGGWGPFLRSRIVLRLLLHMEQTKPSTIPHKHKWYSLSCAKWKSKKNKENKKEVGVGWCTSFYSMNKPPPQRG
jgi:hypothetical protein